MTVRALQLFRWLFAFLELTGVDPTLRHLRYARVRGTRES